MAKISNGPRAGVVSQSPAPPKQAQQKPEAARTAQAAQTALTPILNNQETKSMAIPVNSIQAAAAPVQPVAFSASKPSAWTSPTNNIRVVPAKATPIQGNVQNTTAEATLAAAPLNLAAQIDHLQEIAVRVESVCHTADAKRLVAELGVAKGQLNRSSNSTPTDTLKSKDQLEKMLTEQLPASLKSFLSQNDYAGLVNAFSGLPLKECREHLPNLIQILAYRGVLGTYKETKKTEDTTTERTVDTVPALLDSLAFHKTTSREYLEDIEKAVFKGLDPLSNIDALPGLIGMIRYLSELIQKGESTLLVDLTKEKGPETIDSEVKRLEELYQLTQKYIKRATDELNIGKDVLKKSAASPACDQLIADFAIRLNEDKQVLADKIKGQDERLQRLESRCLTLTKSLEEIETAVRRLEANFAIYITTLKTSKTPVQREMWADSTLLVTYWADKFADSLALLAPAVRSESASVYENFLIPTEQITPMVTRLKDSATKCRDNYGKRRDDIAKFKGDAAKQAEVERAIEQAKVKAFSELSASADCFNVMIRYAEKQKEKLSEKFEAVVQTRENVVVAEEVAKTVARSTHVSLEYIKERLSASKREDQLIVESYAKELQAYRELESAIQLCKQKLEVFRLSYLDANGKPPYQTTFLGSEVVYWSGKFDENRKAFEQLVGSADKPFPISDFKPYVERKAVELAAKAVSK